MTESNLEFLVGKHDFDLLRDYNAQCMTLSVGIYKYVYNKNRDGLKRSKVIVRVKGNAQNLEAINAKAEEIVKELNAGTYYGTKTVYV